MRNLRALPTQKLCSICKKVKARSEFRIINSLQRQTQHLHSYCNSCMKTWKAKNRVDIPYKSRPEEWKQRHKDTNNRYHARKIAKGLCVRCGVRPNETKMLCAVCRKIQNARVTKTNRELKLAAFEAYGGCQCRCPCGCDAHHQEFLTMDHIGGRKKFGHPRDWGGAHLYRWLKNNGYPKGFRVLCMNCNFAIGQFGYCPRDEWRKEAEIAKRDSDDTVVAPPIPLVN